MADPQSKIDAAVVEQLLAQKYVAVRENGNVLDGKRDADALETQAAAIIADIPRRIRSAIEADRVSVFKQLDEEMGDIAKALQALPFRDAESPIKKCQAVMDIISDPLGDHFGTCELCEEPIFVRGQPDDDLETGPEEGSYSHRSCLDTLRANNPEAFSAVDGDDDAPY